MVVALHEENELANLEADIRQRPNGPRVLRQLRELLYLDGRLASSLRKAAELPLVTLVLVLVGAMLLGAVLAGAGASGPMEVFLAHPDRCPWLLGNDHTSAETPSPEFHSDLSAALDASREPSGASLRREFPFLVITLNSRPLPASQAITDLSRRCKQRMGQA